MTDRIISKVSSEIQPVQDLDDFNNNTMVWLLEKAKSNNLRWLLAHANDGVIWGEVRKDGLHLSNILFGPDLNNKTLQTIRLFGETGELLLWRSDSSWKGRLVKDNGGKEYEYYDEGQLLWGTAIESSKDGFVLLYHGAEGLRHAPPIDLQGSDELPLKLNMRHYINFDPDGQAYVEFSRLVSIGTCEQVI